MPLSTDPWFTEGDPFATWPGDTEGLGSEDVAALEELAAKVAGTGAKTVTVTDVKAGPSAPTTQAKAASGKVVDKAAARTPMKLEDAIRVLALTFRMVARVKPFFGQLVFAASQCALETGQFQLMYGYNFGNLMWVGQTPTYWLAEKGTWKGANWSDPARAGIAYWQLMRSKTFRHVLAIAGRERYEDAAIAAVQAGYAAAASLPSYRDSIPKFAKAYGPVIQKQEPGLQRAMPSGVVAAAGGLALFGAAAGVAYKFRNR